MQKIYDEVGTLDQRCYEKFALSEDILMEHAAEGMANFIRKNFARNSSIIIVVGSGNNGADGIACARLLHGDYKVALLYAKEPKSPMAQLQAKRVNALGITEITALHECDVIVDAVVGTGFSGAFSDSISTLINQMNDAKAYKIACDVPSGMQFFANVTLTMGALKKSLFLDGVKDIVGEIEVINLGIARQFYEEESNWNLLDFSDMKLPHRNKKDSHKGSFGHLAVISGEKVGASIISASAALRFGTGLVTLVGFNDVHNLNIPHSLMYSHTLPANTTAIALGMGLGFEFSDAELTSFLQHKLPLLLDADIFHMTIILELLKQKNIVLTPHPKEFVTLLKICNLAEISVDKLQKDRFKYVEMFCHAFPNSVLLLKGANVIIGKGEQFFINPHGDAKLAKGGSGDVLSGLIAALLAQGYTTLEATISASLAHTKLSKNYTHSNFSLTPEDLIEGIGYL